MSGGMMETEEIRTLLRRTPIFQGLSETSLTSIAQSASLQEFEAETPIYEHGGPARELFVLVEGEVALRLFAKSGESYELERRRSQDIFGEAAIWDDGSRMVTAQTTEPTSVLVIPRETLEQLLGPESRFVKTLLAHLAGVMRRASERRIRQADNMI
jgi:CRP-like cAMP-binding protein